MPDPDDYEHDRNFLLAKAKRLEALCATRKAGAEARGKLGRAAYFERRRQKFAAKAVTIILLAEAGG